MNFPMHFTHTVQALYHEAETVVILNGEVSKPFTVRRGVRQGDPLSCLIFNLAIESLAQMLRKSELSGLQIEGVVECLITTLFADDTTIYLSQFDSFQDLNEILDKWCWSSGAKFNVQKTIIVPVGVQTYREEVINLRKLSPDQPPIPPNIMIAPDGHAVRALGAFVGNKIKNVSVWTPVVERIDRLLAQWSKSKPTQIGRHLIISMVVGGLTQYLTRVQGMPPEVEKELTQKISHFMWDSPSTPPVNVETLQLPASQGGKKALNLQARNQAIKLMKCRRYLSFGPQRPLWAYVADILVRRKINKNNIAESQLTAANIFLQSWTVNTRKSSSLSEPVKKMLATAKKFGISLAPMQASPELARSMPIWYHASPKPGVRQQNNSKWAKCQRINHNIKTVGDMLDYVSPPLPIQHSHRKNCRCNVCHKA